MYFLKVNIAIALFYLFYRLFFAGDTFWKTRRYYLLFSVLVSFSYPLLSIEKWLEKQESVKTIVVNYAILPEFTVRPEQQTNWITVENLILIIYLSVLLALMVKMLVQLVSILGIRLQGKKQTVLGISIIALEKEVTPFSFFNAVFMNPALHNEHEISEILAHELTHVRQIHSFDVLVSELLTIAFWFNPATWLLKQEIRQNLEFLADDKVLESGFDSKAYQYHLLQLSYQTPEVRLGNKFNVAPLKKRIIMMNQQKTNKAGLLKYSLIVPLALALVLSSNAQTIVKKAKKVLDTTKEVLTEKNTDKTETTKTMTQPINKTDEKIWDVVEKMPQYPGGEKELLSYLGANIKYPEVAKKNGIHGLVIVRFVVDYSGKVGRTQVMRSVSTELDNEAIRVVNSMPIWTPGEQNGGKVAVYYTLPIQFALDGDNPAVEASISHGLTTNSIKVTTTIKSDEKVSSTDEKAYDVVEKMPQYPGGESELLSYIAKNLKYPVVAQETGTQGMLLVRFVINSEGKVTNTSILKTGLNTPAQNNGVVVMGNAPQNSAPTKPNEQAKIAIENEALRVVNAMSDWTPGEQNNKKVSVWYTLPIKFKLK
jgi:TonB family protein